MSGWNWHEHAAHHHGHGFDFAQEGIRYAILELLEQGPRRGYELIRALEGRSHGFFGPGPALVYPTLEWLADLGYVVATDGEGSKVYSITEEGRRFVAAHARRPDDAWEHLHGWFGGFDEDAWEHMRGWMGGFGCGAFRDEMRDFAHEMREIGKSLHRSGCSVSAEKMHRIHEVVLRAGREVQTILSETEPDAAPQPEGGEAAADI
jgi:DNA-binding PadR family transcriptional regulator